MIRETLTTRCPHCEGPLVLQRAAPGDAHFVIVCADCGARSRSSGDAIETLTLDRPAGLRPVADTTARVGKV